MLPRDLQDIAINSLNKSLEKLFLLLVYLISFYSSPILYTTKKRLPLKDVFKYIYV
jgi:hypothetical protein